MREIGPDNVIEYLHESGRIPHAERATAEALAWGVSNVVLRIEPETHAHFVVKQSRNQLRTAADWFSNIDRIYREMDALTLLGRILPAGVVPRILFEDRDNHLFAMEAVPADHVVWKAELLAGQAEPAIAIAAANYLAMMHTRSYRDSALLHQMNDREVFDQLRIDPFYRHIARKHSQINSAIAQLTDEMLETPVCFVHADFSPKNILVVRDKQQHDMRLVLVDFETAHYGDPAFDLGFFLSHLLLKTVLHAKSADNFFGLIREFHSQYFSRIDQLAADGAMSRAELDRRAVGHTAACMLSRIDGKSTVDYLTDNADQELVRNHCLELLNSRPADLLTTFEQLEHDLANR